MENSSYTSGPIKNRLFKVGFKGSFIRRAFMVVILLYSSKTSLCSAECSAGKRVCLALCNSSGEKGRKERSEKEQNYVDQKRRHRSRDTNNSTLLSALRFLQSTPFDSYPQRRHPSHQKMDGWMRWVPSKMIDCPLRNEFALKMSSALFNPLNI